MGCAPILHRLGLPTALRSGPCDHIEKPRHGPCILRAWPQGQRIKMGFRISVDTGGTFTDIVVMDDAGQQTIGKALTTKNRIFVGMREAVEVAAPHPGQTTPDPLGGTRLPNYGTTRATNAILTRT